MSYGINLSDITEAMEVDKKVKVGWIRFVLPEAIGRVRIEEDVDRGLIKEVLKNS